MTTKPRVWAALAALGMATGTAPGLATAPPTGLAAAPAAAPPKFVMAPAAPDARGVSVAMVLPIRGATVRVATEETEATAFRLGGAPLLAWIQRSADIVSSYYGRFPTRTLSLHVEAAPGERVSGGQTFGMHGGLIRIRVGRDVTDDQLRNDWVLVHEMTHLALPDIGEEHAWLSEGLATYVEGVARVQAGNRSELDVWTEEIHAMPRGLPEPGDQGLDHTHTWGRTYWGGAMFCLIADVSIRERTHNRLGLQDALRAITAASGGIVADWPIERVLRTGDDAVGVHVLEDLYAQWKDTAVTPDLMALWRKLGVEPDTAADSVRLNDSAPLANVRKAIMRPPASKT